MYNWISWTRNVQKCAKDNSAGTSNSRWNMKHPSKDWWISYGLITSLRAKERTTRPIIRWNRFIHYSQRIFKNAVVWFPLWKPQGSNFEIVWHRLNDCGWFGVLKKDSMCSKYGIVLLQQFFFSKKSKPLYLAYLSRLHRIKFTTLNIDWHTATMRSTSAATTDRKFLAEQGFDDVYHTSSPSLFTKMKKQRSIRRNKSKRDNEKAVVVRVSHPDAFFVFYICFKMRIHHSFKCISFYRFF